MSKYNLSPRQESIVKGLVLAYESGYEEEFFYAPTMEAGPAVELFGRSERFPATTTDLVALQQAGFIALREDAHGSLYCSLAGLAFEAVKNDFVSPDPPESRPSINIGNYISNMLGGNVQGAAGANITLNQQADIAMLREKLDQLTEQLAVVLQRLLDAPGYRAAMGSIAEVEQQLGTDQPDAAMATGAARSLGQRILGLLDFGDKLGGSIQAGIFVSEALVTLASWSNIVFQIIAQAGPH